MSHRGHGVPFIAPGVFIHSVARRTREVVPAVPRLIFTRRRIEVCIALKMHWTREHAKRVSSRARSAFHRAGGFHSFRGAPDARARKACPIAGTKCLSSRRSRSPFCDGVDARGRACRSAWRLIVRHKFSADFKKAFSASCIRICCILTTNRARKCRV